MKKFFTPMSAEFPLKFLSIFKFHSMFLCRKCRFEVEVAVVEDLGVLVMAGVEEIEVEVIAVVAMIKVLRNK